MITSDWLKEIEPILTERRTFFHANPELSGYETNTAKEIKLFLQKNTSAQVLCISKTGVLAIFDSNQSGKTVMLRADTDALPIQETNTFSYISNKANISHKCGHDGHTTILLGVALALEKKPLENGKVILLWQPSEENGKGAQAVLKDNFFNKVPIDFVYALHNIPGIKKKEIVLNKSFFTAHVKSMIIKLKGKTAHAAEPEHGNNPSLTISQIIEYCEKITNNTPNDSNFFLITPVYVNIGTKDYGISAGFGEIHLTIRSWSSEVFDDNCDQLIDFINQKSKESKIKTTISWTQEFYANKIDTQALVFLENTLENLMLEYKYIDTPFKWGEDFGFFTEKYKGAMFGIGSGIESPALHNPDYDYPDDITTTAILVFYNLLNEILH